MQLSEDGDDEKICIEVRPDPGASSRQYSPYW
jgi:hypothetical protein